MIALHDNPPVTIDSATLASLLAASSKNLRELRTAWIDTDDVEEARKLKLEMYFAKAYFEKALSAYKDANHEEK